jgi:hypothetical protein
LNEPCPKFRTQDSPEQTCGLLECCRSRSSKCGRDRLTFRAAQS